MNQTIEQLYQEIGRTALASVTLLAGKVLVYAEVEEGTISADMFYVNQDGSVHFKFCTKPMQVLIYSLWERWKEQSENREWRVMCYTINDGKFSIDLTYPDQIIKDEEISDRRPRAIKKYFGGMKVNYSNP